MLRITSLLYFFPALLFATPSLSHAITPTDTPIPDVTGPISVTEGSHPFHTSRFDLTPYGYVEEEFFVSGKANIYEWNTDGRVEIQTPDAPYTTRILVWRPEHPADFSGDVIVELFNPTALFDIAILWGECHHHFMRRGDAYVGITSKPVAVKTLKAFDPERYAPLSWANPLPVEETCVLPFFMRIDSSPETENGLVWDIVSQVGALLRSDSPANPLAGFAIDQLYATGYSQTGMYLVTYVNAIHPQTFGNGDPIYDGYLIAANFGVAYPINQCAGYILPGDPRNTILRCTVPVIIVATQTDYNSWGRRPDSDAPEDGFRLYEVAGSAHAGEYSLTDTGPTEEDILKAGIPAATISCAQQLTTFPLRYILNGAFTNLDRWVEAGTPPPRAGRIVGTSAKFTAKDEFGNALGGVRTPYVDVPVATYNPSSTGLSALDFFCALFGHLVPFSDELLRELYPTHQEYVREVFQSVHDLLQQRWITEADAWEIKREAWQAPVP